MFQVPPLAVSNLHSSPLDTCFPWIHSCQIPSAYIGQCYKKHAYAIHPRVSSNWKNTWPGNSSCPGLASQVHGASSDIRGCTYLPAVVFILPWEVRSHVPPKTWWKPWLLLHMHTLHVGYNFMELRDLSPDSRLRTPMSWIKLPSPKFCVHMG